MCIFELIFLSLRSINILWYLFIDGDNVLNNIIIPRNQKNSISFVEFGYGSGFCSITVLLSLLGVSVLMVCIIIVFDCIKP